MNRKVVVKKMIVWLVIVCLFIPFSQFNVSAEVENEDRDRQPTDLVGHWAKDTLQLWLEAGYITGYSDGSVRPDQQVTRAELMTMINRAFGFIEKVDVEFNDVKEGDWWFDAILIAVQAGYIEGYDDGTVRPMHNVNREELATMIARLIKLEQLETVAEFEDADAISGWAVGNVNGIHELGIMSGYPDGSFQPKRMATRAEAVISLAKALEMVNEKVANDEDDSQLNDVLEQDQLQGNVSGEVVFTEDGELMEYGVLTFLNKSTSLEYEVTVKDGHYDADLPNGEYTLSSYKYLDLRDDWRQLSLWYDPTKIDVIGNTIVEKISVPKLYRIQMIISKGDLSLRPGLELKFRNITTGLLFNMTTKNDKETLYLPLGVYELTGYLNTGSNQIHIGLAFSVEAQDRSQNIIISLMHYVQEANVSGAIRVQDGVVGEGSSLGIMNETETDFYNVLIKDGEFSQHLPDGEFKIQYIIINGQRHDQDIHFEVVNGRSTSSLYLTLHEIEMNVTDGASDSLIDSGNMYVLLPGQAVSTGTRVGKIITLPVVEGKITVLLPRGKYKIMTFVTNKNIIKQLDLEFTVPTSGMVNVPI